MVVLRVMRRAGRVVRRFSTVMHGRSSSVRLSMVHGRAGSVRLPVVRRFSMVHGVHG